MGPRVGAVPRALRPDARPAIVGRADNLSPPATKMAVLVGGAAAGVPGALVATPLFAASKAVYLDRRGQMPEPETQVMRKRLSGLRRRLPWRRRAERAGEADPRK